MGTEMKRALLFGSVPCGDGAFLRPYLDGGGWTVFCADGGVRNARAAGLRPDYLIGDWDSGGAPEGDVPCITLPVEKDMTDLQAAVDQALELDYRGAPAVRLYWGTAGPYRLQLGASGVDRRPRRPGAVGGCR